LSQTIFITGGTGFLGAYIIKELSREDFTIRALRRTDQLPSFLPKEIFERVHWVEGDLFDVVTLEECMKDVDIVIHAAALVSFNKKERDLLYKTNVEGTANVVNAAIEAGVKRMVHVSSVAALGRTSEGEEVDEEKKWVDASSNTHYAVSKYRGEMEVWRGMGEGLDVVIVNPSTILGYGNWQQSSSALFKNAYNEFPWYTEGINGFVDVEDVARATVQLMKSTISNQRFLINGENWSFRNLFNAIADGFGKKRPHLKATPLMGAIAWRLEAVKSLFTGQKPLLTKETAKVAQTATYFNHNKLLKALPEFRFTPLKECIDKTCRLYLLEHQNKMP
jgi:nucleoside-diphosphate-sugar epimerase